MPRVKCSPWKGLWPRVSFAPFIVFGPFLELSLTCLLSLRIYIFEFNVQILTKVNNQCKLDECVFNCFLGYVTSLELLGVCSRAQYTKNIGLFVYLLLWFYFDDALDNG
jgi:hypothetical protein